MRDYRYEIWLRLTGELLIAIACYYAAFYVRLNVQLPFTEKLLPVFNFEQLPHYWWMIALVQATVLYFLGAYDTDDPEAAASAPRVIVAGVTLTTLVLIAFYFFMDVRFPRTVLLIFWALDVPVLLLWQWALGKLRVPKRRRRALLVGVNPTSYALVREIERRPWLGLTVVGLVHEDALNVPVSPAGEAVESEPATEPPIPVLGTREDLAQLVAKHGIDHVILNPEPTWQDRLIDQIGHMSGWRTKVTLVPSPFDIIIGKPQQRRVHDIPLIDFLREPMGPGDRALKRATDIAGALLLVALVAPVLVLTALAIKTASPGPVFYRQIRVGRGGREFSIVKFRTMVLDAEKLTGAVFAQKDDPRVFPLGRFLRKTRIDELPQLFNILAGQMSFVGPRPERPEFVAQFREQIPGYVERLRVKPGVTGLAQVNGYYETTPENKLKFDLAYIYNYSLLIDAKILVATVKVVLTLRGT